MATQTRISLRRLLLILPHRHRRLPLRWHYSRRREAHQFQYRMLLCLKQIKFSRIRKRKRCRQNLPRHRLLQRPQQRRHLELEVYSRRRVDRRLPCQTMRYRRRIRYWPSQQRRQLPLRCPHRRLLCFRRLVAHRSPYLMTRLPRPIK